MSQGSVDDCENIQSQGVVRRYSYQGGTTHPASWALFICAGVLAWLLFGYYGGRDNISSASQFWGLVFFSILLPVASALSIEWTFRNTPGWIEVTEKGLYYNLPWGRKREMEWNMITEVRCTSRRFTQDYSFWEIKGRSPKDRLTFSWQLPGYKDLLWTIKRQSKNCRLFDEI